jgi:hypothetical protein
MCYNRVDKIYVIADREICQEIKWGRGRNFKEGRIKIVTKNEKNITIL